jgi:hypothetical protein
MNILIQAIGLIAFIIVALSYWQKEKANILVLQIISYVVYAIHYYLLGGISGAIINIAGTIGLIVIYYKDKKNIKNKWLLFLIILLYSFFWAFTYEDVFSILPLIASLPLIIVLWQNKSFYIRVVGLIGTISWIIYSFHIGSYIGVITATIFLISTSLAIYKLDIKGVRKCV